LCLCSKIKLIYANVAEKDIWLKEYFDRAAQSSPDKFAVHYVLEKVPLHRVLLNP